MSTNCRLEPKDSSQGSAGDNVDISAQDIQRSCEEANVAGFINELDGMSPDLKVVVAGTALVSSPSRSCYDVSEVRIHIR
jgi:hypothetical protein